MATEVKEATTEQAFWDAVVKETNKTKALKNETAGAAAFAASYKKLLAAEKTFVAATVKVNHTVTDAEKNAVDLAG